MQQGRGMVNSIQYSFAVAKRKGFCLLLAIITAGLLGCNPFYGFIESEFSLAADSRLPKWIAMPSEYSREDTSIFITFYSSNKVRFTVRGQAPESKLLIEKIGVFRWHPTTKQKGFTVYPIHFIISVDGTEETFAQMKPEPFLYVVDLH